MDEMQLETMAAEQEMPRQVIGIDQIKEAGSILQKYKEGKANLERRVVENERWYRMRHWEHMKNSDSSGVEPVSGWLFNSLANKHADAMDNYPMPNVLPREQDDKAEAKRLSSILPVVLEMNDLEAVYDAVQDDKLKHGTGIYGIFWDPDKLGGLGDIAISAVDVLNIFWEPGVSDIQQSRNVFHVVLADNEALEERYPEARGHLGTQTGVLAQYVHDDEVDTSQKSAVVDWYYRRNGVLHYCKYVNDVILFASENEAGYENGWYAHGQYPFVFDTMYRCKGTPCGFGFIDIGKSAQEYIDRANKALLQNLLANAKPRHFIRSDGAVNEAEYADMSKDFIHVDGNLGQDSILPVPMTGLPGIYVSLMQDKVNELKEVTGNRDVSNGGSTGGVTAASAIAAMQEAGSKLSRDNNKSAFRSFRKLCLLAVELIRQFYELPRSFRITGQEGMEEYISYTNAGIQPMQMGDSLRQPLFDLEITAQKASPYSKMAQNELALQFYGAGFFNPQLADQALACLDMMDFDRKGFIEEKIRQNGTLYQQVQMLTQTLAGMAAEMDGITGGNRLQQVMQLAGMTAQPMGGTASAAGQAALGDTGSAEASNTRQARERVAESTAPT